MTVLMRLAPLLLAVIVAPLALAAWDPKEVENMDAKAQEAKAEMLSDDESMQRYFDSAAAYVIIPTVGKAGIGIGGARGTGLLYEDGKPSAKVTLTQLTIGFQWGGQAYSEFLFFKDAKALENFKRGNYELGAQASAVAVTAGASADASYDGGVAIFTRAKGGLMYEASVGGQKFKVEALD
jgi:lipid-binding SYLF domain-containing protein